uniref:CUB_2 domain-containing protein n=1 Tax=Caenorhabditis tropicalis TaxID=1561998 RepID=A0A1I7U286_9PELO
MDFQSDSDTVFIFDNNNKHKYYLVNTGSIYYDSLLIMPARGAAVQVVGVSGKTRFFMSYTYQSLSGYQQVLKNTGDYFPLSTVNGNNFYTITASTTTDQVVAKFAQMAGTYLDPYLHDIFVYDGDNINTATQIGSLDEVGSTITVSAGRSISLVNLYNSGPSVTAYFLGNDASTVQGYSKYSVILATNQSRISGTLSDLTDFGAAYTFICLDCSNYYWASMNFDELATIADKGFISFRGQTPTHQRERLIRYDPLTYTSSYLPQLLPTDVFTLNLYLSRIAFNLTTTSPTWNAPFDGRKGYIFSPNLCTPSANSFNYEFRDDTQLYNYTLNFDKTTYALNTDLITLRIGSGNSTPTLDAQYPRDPITNGKVSATGNYMQIGLAASAGADIRLSFNMAQAITPSVSTTQGPTVQTTTPGGNQPVFTCPTSPITVATGTGNLPSGATNLTVVPAGTNCTFTFDIPNNYAIQLRFSMDFQSDSDTVFIFDNNNKHKYYLVNTGSIYYNSLLIMPARGAAVQVVGVSGKTRFFMSYTYQSLSGYQQVLKNTGEYFPLSTVNGNNFYTITASTATDQVVAKFAQMAGTYLDPYLHDIFVYDGDNINTATQIGSLDEVGSTITVSAGRSISLVNLYNSGPSVTAYFLGNDASTVQGYSKYSVILATNQSRISGQLSDLTDFGAAYTFICLNCSTYYWASMNFDDLATIADKGFISFRGQTPTHRREQLIRYNPLTYTSSYLPQLLPTDVFTLNLYLARIAFNLTTTTTTWNAPFDGRKGYIFSPNLWTPSANTFNYEFRDDTQLYNYTLNFDKTTYAVNTDQITLRVGSGNSTPTLDAQYPRDPITNGKVSATGNYMQIGLAASAGADIRLSFNMAQATPPVSTTPGVSTTAGPNVTVSTVQTTTAGGTQHFNRFIIAVLVLLAIL